MLKVGLKNEIFAYITIKQGILGFSCFITRGVSYLRFCIAAQPCSFSLTVLAICELSSCLRRSYNILKEVKCPQDIDNTHATSLIERKMTKDDVKIWARHIHSQKLEPSMKHLLQWIDEKMTARLGSGARICKTSSTTRPSVNLLGADGNGNSSGEHDKNQKQCYVCKASHDIDECPQFKAMTPNERGRLLRIKKSVFKFEAR